MGNYLPYLEDDEDEAGAGGGQVQPFATVAPDVPATQSDLFAPPGGTQMPSAVGSASAQPNLKEILLKKYADAEKKGNEDIADAQRRSVMSSALGAIGQAVEGYVRAPGVARGGPGVNHAGYQAMAQQGQNLVQAAKQGKQTGMDAVLKEHAMGKQLDDEAQVAAQRDPNSDISKNFRSFVQSTYPDLKIPEGMSYADAKEKVPMLAQAHEAQETKRYLAEQKLNEAKARQDMLAEQKRQFNINRDDARTDKDFTALTDHLKGSVRDSIGQEKSKLRNATHAMALIPENGNLDNLTPEQMKEVAGVLAAQVAGSGSPAESIVHDMTPKTFKGDFAKAMSYITGAPEGASQGEYAKMYREMVKRQMDTSKQIIAGEYQPIVANYRHLSKKDPARMKAILQGAGVDMDPNGQIIAYEPHYSQMPGADSQLGPKGKPGEAIAAPAGATTTVAPQSHPQASAALEWAKANPKDPRAAAIMQRFAQPQPGPTPTP